MRFTFRRLLWLLVRDVCPPNDVFYGEFMKQEVLGQLGEL